MLLKAVLLFGAVGTSALASFAVAPRYHLRVAPQRAAVALPTAARLAPRAPAIFMADAAEATESDGVFETLKTASFFALWYLFNIGYNIYNKKAAISASPAAHRQPPHSRTASASVVCVHTEYGDGSGDSAVGARGCVVCSCVAAHHHSTVAVCMARVLSRECCLQRLCFNNVKTLFSAKWSVFG